jgi:3-oxoacyl-[acyl-carrier-protein] synthase II
MREVKPRRVVITGMGAITPIGNSVDAFWQSCLAGVSGIAEVSVFDASPYPAHIAGEVKNFDPGDYIEHREARRMGRFTQLAVAASYEALNHSGLELEREDRERIGVVLGVGIGGLPNVDEGVRTIVEKGGMRLDPLFLPKMLPNMAAARLALIHGLKGYNNTATTACAAGTHAMGDAAHLIRWGLEDVMITGGAEAAISEVGLCGFAVMRALSTENEPPEKASKPFDARRDGFVAAEGAGIFIMETLEHAQARGAEILAEVIGYGNTNDAYHIVAPCADGDGAIRCMQLALEDAGISPGEVDYINAHGTSTPLNDAAETSAIKRVFGEYAYRIPVSSTKSMIGHAFGAAGAMESVASIKTLETGWIHPTINYEEPDPECDLDYVPNEPRQADVKIILKNSFGFGGQNASLVLKRFDG